MSEPSETTITPFLMFTGQAEEAMNFYVSLFPDAAVESISRYDSDGAGAEGTVELALFSLSGQKVRCIDNPGEQDFTFNPAISLFVTCASREEFDRYVEALGQGGEALMPPDNYGFSTIFAWLNDRFGVSWQLNLP